MNATSMSELVHSAGLSNKSTFRLMIARRAIAFASEMCLVANWLIKVRTRSLAADVEVIFWLFNAFQNFYQSFLIALIGNLCNAFVFVYIKLQMNLRLGFFFC